MNDHKVEWTAFQYISGELTAAESERFEARLAEDEAACLAVSQAVQVTQSLHAGLSSQSSPNCTPMRSRPAARRSRSRLAIAVAAACVVAVLAIAFQSQPVGHDLADNADPAPTVLSDAEPTAELIQMYVDAQPSAPLVREEVQPLNEFESAGDKGIEVPAWMFAAVSTEMEQAH